MAGWIDSLKTLVHIDLYLFIGFLGADKPGESGMPVNKRLPVKGSEVYPIRMNCIRFLLTLQY